MGKLVNTISMVVMKIVSFLFSAMHVFYTLSCRSVNSVRNSWVRDTKNPISGREEVMLLIGFKS